MLEKLRQIENRYAELESKLADPAYYSDPAVFTKLCREQGITVVLITHHMDECINADRLVVMSNGHIVADGTPGEVFSDVALMEREGLSVPETTRLLYELDNEAGVDLPLDALTAADCAEKIAQSLK